MMTRIQRTLRRIAKDLKNFRNVDAYIVSIFALFLFVVTLIADVVPPNIKDGVILGALGLLVFNLTVPKQPDVTGYDDMLDDRSGFKIPFYERIKTATQLYIYAPSAVNILNADNTRAIVDHILSRKDGEFKIIVQDPDETEAVKILAKQLDENVIRQMQSLDTALASSITKLKNIATWEREGVFEYKLLSFGPGFSLVAINPTKADGVVIIEFYGYTHEDTSSRMHIEMTRADSERWYTYWVSQFDAMWKDARSVDGMSTSADTNS